MSYTQVERLDRCCRSAEHCCNSWPTCADPKFAARQGMYRTCDVIDQAKERHDLISVADGRTTMCDYRLAFALAAGRAPDRNGFCA